MLSLNPCCSSVFSSPLLVAEEPEVYEAAAAVDTESASSRAPLELDAFELHRRIIGLQRLSDRCRYDLLKLLAVLDDGRRYLELGYSSTKHYLVRELRVGRTNALELVRVARRLGELPRLGAALADGDLRWSTLRELSRVATPETEAEWLEFATTHTFEQTVHEVKRAIAERRDRPADSSDYGLTNVLTRISFELTLEEKERFMTAMARVTEEMGDGAPTDLASTLTFLSQRILERQPVVGATVHNVDAAAGNLGATEPTAVHNVDGVAAPGLTVVYHRYADGSATVDTPDGPVRVSSETVDRIADVAQEVTLTDDDVAAAEPLPGGEIDRPNDATIARKVRTRDGERCANPGCGRRDGLQAHHIRFRSQGGRTVLQNEVTLCRTCHTLVHAGLLEVKRAAAGDLRCRPRARALSLECGVSPWPSLDALTADVAMPSPSSTATPVTHLDIDELVGGLTRLGFTKQEARQRLDTALAKLSEQARASAPSSGSGSVGAIDEAAVLSEALRVRHV